MKIETENNCSLIFNQVNTDSNLVSVIWKANYATKKFDFDFIFNEQIFKSQELEINWDSIKFVVNKIESEIISINSKSENLCKALYQEIFGKIDTEKYPFELSSIEIRGIQKIDFLENAFKFYLELDYFQIEDYYLTYSTKFTFDINYFSLESVRRGNGYE